VASGDIGSWCGVASPRRAPWSRSSLETSSVFDALLGSVSSSRPPRLNPATSGSPSAAIEVYSRWDFSTVAGPASGCSFPLQDARSRPPDQPNAFLGPLGDLSSGSPTVPASPRSSAPRWSRRWCRQACGVLDLVVETSTLRRNLPVEADVTARTARPPRERPPAPAASPSRSTIVSAIGLEERRRFSAKRKMRARWPHPSTSTLTVLSGAFISCSPVVRPCRRVDVPAGLYRPDPRSSEATSRSRLSSFIMSSKRAHRFLAARTKSGTIMWREDDRCRAASRPDIARPQRVRS